MAPRKAKAQGKRNNIKIKSKVIPQKRALKPAKKVKVSEKPLGDINWLEKLSSGRAVKKCSGVPEWLDTGGYKHGTPRRGSEGDVSEYGDYPPKEEEEKSTVSDLSEECNCSISKFSENKGGILKRKISSTNSIVAKYIKSGMNHVASFIVESAIRFGEQHGVVIPDKNLPNVYEITPPDKLDEKFRKIRFKIPDKSLGYEDAKKVMWRSHKNPGNSMRAGPPVTGWKDDRLKKTESCGSSRGDSLEEILPLLEKMKGKGEAVKSDVDLQKLKGDPDRERRDRERDRDRERERDRDRKRERSRHREKLREKFRSINKRFKSVGAEANKASEEDEYFLVDKNPWKKFRRDSVELGRQRLRTSTCPKKPGSRSKPPSRSPSPY